MNGRIKKYGLKELFLFWIWCTHIKTKEELHQVVVQQEKENEIVFLATDTADGSRMGGQYYTMGKTSKIIDLNSHRL